MLDKLFLLDKYGGRYTWESIDKMHNIAVEYMKMVTLFQKKAQELKTGNGNSGTFMNPQVLG